MRGVIAARRRPCGCGARWRGAPALALVVRVAADPMAPSDGAHFAASCGHELVDQVQDGAVLRFIVRKAASADGADHGARPE